MAKQKPEFHERVRTRMHGDYYSSSAAEIIITSSPENSDDERRAADIAFITEKAGIPAYMAEIALDKADKGELLSFSEAKQLIAEHDKDNTE